MKNKLKNKLWLTALLGSLFCVIPGTAMAQIGDVIEADIPFQFHVENATFPPGKYTIKTLGDSDQSMEISSNNLRHATFFQIVGTEARTTPDTSELVFNKVGHRYFLSKVFEEASRSGDKLLKTPYERRLSEGVGPASARQ